MTKIDCETLVLRNELARAPGDEKELSDRQEVKTSGKTDNWARRHKLKERLRLLRKEI